MEDLHEDIKVYKQMEQDSNEAFWEDLQKVAEYELEKKNRFVKMHTGPLNTTRMCVCVCVCVCVSKPPRPHLCVFWFLAKTCFC